jgi:hypothetical protein
MDNIKSKSNYFTCSEHPLLWFVETSYGYVNPRGVLEHLKFVFDLPRASFKFLKSMREYG